MMARFLDMNAVTAVVLAGGLGTRLRGTVPDRPKALAEVAGRPFLDYILDWLARSGVTRAVLAVGHMADKVADHCGKRHGPIELLYSREQAPLGTGGALRLAAPWVATKLALVLNGDSLVEADLREFVRWFQERQAKVGILAVSVADAGRYGRLVLADDGRIESFSEKQEGAGPGFINSGVYLMGRETLAALPDTTPLSLEHDVFPGLIGQGFHAYPAEGRFIDIGTPGSFTDAQTLFDQGAWKP